MQMASTNENETTRERDSQPLHSWRTRQPENETASTTMAAMALLVSIATIWLYCLEWYRTIDEEQGRSAATMASVMNNYEVEIAERVGRRETYENISWFLQHVLPHSRGLSTRSVRRFCSERGNRYRSGLNDSELDKVVSARVRAVGDSYGQGHFMVYFTQKGSMYLKGELLPHLGTLTLTSLLQELNHGTAYQSCPICGSLFW